MTGKQWLTIEDWLECSLPLCPLEIKHEGRLDQSDTNAYQTVFTSSRLGGSVLYHGSSQECIYFSTFPEMLAILLYVEALEDNEALTIENLHQVSHVRDIKDKAVFEKLDVPKKTSLCCIDAENYSSCPPTQFEEDNVLRELNKCLLAYRQNALCPIVEARDRKGTTKEDRRNRLSPIGENNLSADAMATIIVKQASTATLKSSCDSQRMERGEFLCGF
jgi:poly(ADP-ribose) glycohydrolase